MKIKNIRDYRKYYKETVRDQPTREEDFIGNFYIDQASKKKRFGWFEIYHGDKEGYGKAEAGIENFLQSFLDMARDGQAVYEFLQNAVDAHSTHFTMVWGKDESDGNQYLLVANNGDMFSFNSIRSILNVGSSTKSADSQTIGKFGIGFKLAHRLVGKDNGLQELLHENSGPILFSWANHELSQLAGESPIEPKPIVFEATEDQQHRVLDTYPWLFKILITCFPCLPENEQVDERPRLADGVLSESNPFSAQELGVLRNWVARLIPSLDRETYQKGSLFFIRLGKGKDGDLADNNLREGVKFSLAVLNKTADKAKQSNVLSTVQLNDGEPIQIPELRYLTFGISKEKEQSDYCYIRFGIRNIGDLQRDQKEKLEREADIEVLIGFKPYDDIHDHFLGAPNFYLYFPLSEEAHNFNYILHCNAFYKGSSRTFLHKGSKGEDGINERLLAMIADRLLVQLVLHAESSVPEERSLFLDLYAALLTSGESINQDRLWIKQPYVQAVNDNLKKVIPIQSAAGFSVAGPQDKVYIKATHIALSPDWLKEDIHWFYWDTAYPDFCSAAAGKLELATYDIFSLLHEEGVFGYLNDWLDGQSDRINLLLTELSIPVHDDRKTEQFIYNFSRLKMLEFSDGAMLSLLELYERETDGYLILHNNWSTIADLLLKLQFKTSKRNFNELNIIAQYQNWLSAKSQLKEHKIMTRLFSSYAKDEDLLALSPAEKFRIFCAVRDLNSDNRGDRLRELKLYCNKGGQIAYFKNLLQETELIWLRPYVIDEQEYQQELRFYLINKESDFYEAIIYPYWPQISVNLKEKDREAILDKTSELFALSKPEEGEKQLLSAHGLIFFQGTSTAVEELFYTKALAEIPEEVYSKLQLALYTYYNVQLPDRFFLPYADQEMFMLPQATPELTDTLVELPKTELGYVLEFCRFAKVDFFGRLLISGEGELLSTAGKEASEQFLCNNSLLSAYAASYYPGEYLALPLSLESYSDLLTLDHDAFAAKLVERFEEDGLEPELDLIDGLLKESLALRLVIFNKITATPLDITWKAERQNRTYLSFLGGILQLEPTTIAEIDQKIVLKDGEESLDLEAVEQASDTIELQRGDKKVMISQSELLNLPGKSTLRQIKVFAQACADGHYLTQAQADLIFKLSAGGISDELTRKFEDGLKDKLLTNSHQLAFAILSGKYTSEEIKSFSITGADRKTYDLSGPWVLHGADLELYAPSYTLGETYADLSEVLQFSPVESFQYAEGLRDVLVPSFLFVNGCEPAILNSEASAVLLLTELLKRMNQTPREIFQEDQAEQDWEKELHFNPKACILHEHILTGEKLPDEVLTWLEQGTRTAKIRLLTLLGVSGPNSRIVSLRKWLLEPAPWGRQDNDWLLIPHGFLYDTLILLTQIESEFSLHDHRLSLLENIAGKLIEANYETIPVLVYQDAELLIFSDPDENYIYDLPVQLADEGLTGLYQQADILYTAHRYAAELKAMVEILPVREALYCQGEGQEHNEPYYKRLKSEYELSLIKVQSVLAKVYAVLSNGELLIGTTTPERQYLVKDEELSYNELLTLEQLGAQIDEEEELDFAGMVGDMIVERNQALANFYHVISLAGTAEGEQGVYRAIQKVLQEQNSRAERQTLLDNMNGAAKYSYDWFLSLLEYLHTYEQVVGSTAQRSLNFQSIARYRVEGVLSEKYFMLYGAANLIPVNVDAFKDFSVSLVFASRKKETIKVDGVSARGQDMLIYCPSGLAQYVLDNLEQVASVSISFTPTLNLLGQLLNAFKHSGYINPWVDIREALPPLEFIYGPPGTGKTTSICTTISTEYSKNPRLRCLVLTPTNKAADVLVKKLLQLDTGLQAVRISSVTDPELEGLDEEVYQTSLTLADTDFYQVTAATMHRFPYFKLKGDPQPDQTLYQLREHWDLVVIDEASMVSLPYMVFILMSMTGQAKMPRLLIAGDPMQIPPVMDLSDKDLEETDVADMNIYSMLGIRSFKHTEQVMRDGDKITNLDKQYRSVEAIGRLFSEISYKGQLEHHRDFKKEPAKILPAAVSAILNGPVNFISFPLKDTHAIYEHRKLLYSAYHLYAGMLTAELISFFDKAKPEENWNIGIVTPYKAQALITNKLIRAKKLSDKLHIVCDTVHSFQGDQCDLVIFIVNPNNWNYTGHPKSLLSKDYVYNVAISRARDYLWIFNPFNNLTNPHISKMVSVNSQGTGTSKIHLSSQLEKQLFGETQFLEDYSFVSGHDHINIYGHSEMRYFIRLNDSAVDVHVPEL